jgi:hypothetical protein
VRRRKEQQGDDYWPTEHDRKNHPPTWWKAFAARDAVGQGGGGEAQDQYRQEDH